MLPAYIYFKDIRELNYPQDKLISLKDSIKEFDEYIEHYHFEYHRCPKTNLKHISIVFTFNDKHLSLENISSETVKFWKLEGYQYLFNKKSNEPWNYGCTFYVGTPPIGRVLPESILRDIFDNVDEYHVGGSSECFSTSLS